MKITEEYIGNVGVKTIFEYEDVDSFDHLQGEHVTQVYAVCFVGEKIIVVHKAKTDSWSLIGGTIDSGETFEEALAREIHEEGNLKMLSAKPIGFQRATNTETGVTDVQLRYVCVAEPFGPFEEDPDGGIDRVEFIDPKNYKKYFDWGQIGERIMERANEITIRNLINIATRRMTSAYSAYHIWKTIETSRNLNIGEERAHRNVNIMKPFPGFFKTILLGAFYIFVIDLSVFFDRNNKSFSLNKIISKLNLSEEDLKEIENIINLQKNNIKSLKDRRDKDIAHFDLNIDRTEINKIIYKDCEDLFDAVQKIFDIITTSIDRSSWFWDHLSSDATGEVEFLFNNLERGENQRLADIDEEYKSFDP